MFVEEIQVEEYNYAHVNSLQHYDDGIDLKDYDFECDNLVLPPFDVDNLRKLTYRHRYACNLYKQVSTCLSTRSWNTHSFVLEKIFDLWIKYSWRAGFLHVLKWTWQESLLVIQILTMLIDLVVLCHILFVHILIVLHSCKNLTNRSVNHEDIQACSNSVLMCLKMLLTVDWVVILQGLEGLLSMDQKKEWQELYEATDEFTDQWLSGGSLFSCTSCIILNT